MAVPLNTPFYVYFLILFSVCVMSNKFILFINSESLDIFIYWPSQLSLLIKIVLFPVKIFMFSLIKVIKLLTPLYQLNLGVQFVIRSFSIYYHIL